MELTADSLEALLSRVATADALVVLFNEATCRVGAAVEGKVLQLVAHDYPRMDVMHVDTVHLADAVRHYGVQAVPTLMVFFAGKETACFVRTFGIEEVRQAIARPYAIMFE